MILEIFSVVKSNSYDLEASPDVYVLSENLIKTEKHQNETENDEKEKGENLNPDVHVLAENLIKTEKHQNETENDEKEKGENLKTQMIRILIFIVVSTPLLCILGILIHKIHPREKQVENVSEMYIPDGGISLDLGVMDNDMIFFTPPREICFIISRTGHYSLDLSIRRRFFLTTSQKVFVIFKSQPPTVMINKTLSGGTKSSIWESTHFFAREQNQICLLSDKRLDESQGNFIIIQFLE